jgi:glycerophosphoryl diester phosphodiesterase
MESEDLNQYRNTQNAEVIQPRIQVSKDGKWVIIRLEVEGKTITVIKPVAYFEKIFQRARDRPMGTPCE